MIDLVEIARECLGILNNCNECQKGAPRLVFGVCEPCLEAAQEECYQLAQAADVDPEDVWEDEDTEVDAFEAGINAELDRYEYDPDEEER